jgi:hypothetical protein
MRELEKFKDLEIDWNMTPEDAVALYLEWGNTGYAGYESRVRGKADHSYYFVVYAWEKKPCVFLIRRDSEGSEILATLNLPRTLEESFMKHTSGFKGVYAPTEEIKAWLKKGLYN